VNHLEAQTDLGEINKEHPILPRNKVDYKFPNYRKGGEGKSWGRTEPPDTRIPCKYNTRGTR